VSFNTKPCKKYQINNWLSYVTAWPSTVIIKTPASDTSSTLNFKSTRLGLWLIEELQITIVWFFSKSPLKTRPNLRSTRTLSLCKSHIYLASCVWAITFSHSLTVAPQIVIVSVMRASSAKLLLRSWTFGEFFSIGVVSQASSNHVQLD